MTAHRDGCACTGAVVRKPPVKERAGDGVPTVTRALWRFDRGGDGGRKTRERRRQKMACAGGSRARLSRMPELGPYGSVRGARGNSRPLYVADCLANTHFAKQRGER